MHPFGRIATALAVILGLACSSHAASLFAAPATSSFDIWSYETTYCTILNTRTSDLTVTIRTHKYNGNIVDDSGPVTLPSENGYSFTMSQSAQYCEFVVAGSTKSVRAMAISKSAATGDYTVATPAQ